MATLPAWANLEFLVIEFNPQYIANPDTGEIVVQPGWFEITTTEQLAEVEQQIQSLTPTPPPPAAEWSQWQFTSRGDFRLVFGAVMAVDPFSATILSGLITNTPNTNLDSLATIWNEAMAMVDTGAIADPLAAIDASAVSHHIPLHIGAGGVMTVVT